jgi:hypothetical protein
VPALAVFFFAHDGSRLRSLSAARAASGFLVAFQRLNGERANPFFNFALDPGDLTVKEIAGAGKLSRQHPFPKRRKGNADTVKHFGL